MDVAGLCDHDLRADESGSVALAPGGIERRRPGRATHVDAALIPLLRRPTPWHDAEPAESDDLAAPIGVGAAVVLSSLLWIAGRLVLELVW